MEKSKFERLSDVALVRYCKFVKNLLEQIDNLWYDNIESFNQFFSGYRDSYASIRGQIMGPLGGSFSRLDIEYLFYLLENSDLESDSIRRPKLIEKPIEFIIQERVKVRVTKQGFFETYLGDHLSQGYLFDLRSDGDIEPYDWDETDREELDWDSDDEWFNF